MANPSKNEKSPSLYRFDWYRCLMFAFFLHYTVVVARGLVPFPEEPHRIKFYGLFCVTVGFVIAYQMLVNRYRLFLFGVLGFLPMAYHQLGKRARFLEMMLETRTWEVWTRYALIACVILLFIPPAWRRFNRSIREYQPSKPLLFRKGLPF